MAIDGHIIASLFSMRPRRLQFRLRTLLLLVGVASVLFGVLAHRERQYRARLRAVGALERDAGVRVCVRDPSAYEGRRCLYGEALRRDDVVVAVHIGVPISDEMYRVDQPISDVMVAALRELQTLESVAISGRGASDAQLAVILDRPRLEKLSVTNSHLGDELAPHLLGLTSLRTLILAETRVTGCCLLSLPSMDDLEWLDLSGDEISDESLRHVAGLHKLKQLILTETPVSDVGLVHLRQLTSLEQLHLSGCLISDAGLAHLTALRKLTGLYLSGTKVTDNGLAHLGGLTALGTLYLNDCEITDAGLPVLAEMMGSGKLHSVDIMGTKVTAAGVARLLASFPNDRYPPPMVTWFEVGEGEDGGNGAKP